MLEKTDLNQTTLIYINECSILCPVLEYVANFLEMFLVIDSKRGI